MCGAMRFRALRFGECFIRKLCFSHIFINTILDGFQRISGTPQNPGSTAEKRGKKRAERFPPGFN